MFVISIWVLAAIIIPLALLGLYFNAKKRAVIATILFVFVITVGFYGVFCGEPYSEERLDTTVYLVASGSNFSYVSEATVDGVSYYVGQGFVENSSLQNVKFEILKSTLIKDDNETPRAEVFVNHNLRKLFDNIAIDDGYSLGKIVLYVRTFF